MKYVKPKSSDPWHWLSKPQQETYSFILRYLNKNHFPPSNREIQNGLNLRSIAPVTQRLDQLQKAGWITRRRGEARTIALTQHQPIWLPVNQEKEAA